MVLHTFTAQADIHTYTHIYILLFSHRATTTTKKREREKNATTVAENTIYIKQLTHSHI